MCVCGCCVVDLWYVVAWLFCLWVLLVYLLDARVLYVLCAGGDSWGFAGVVRVSMICSKGMWVLLCLWVGSAFCSRRVGC